MMPICLLLLELNNTNEVSNNYTKIRIVTLGFVISIFLDALASLGSMLETQSVT